MDRIAAVILVLAGFLFNASIGPAQNRLPANSITSEMVNQYLNVEGSIVEIIPATSDTTPHRFVLVAREKDPIEIVFWKDMEKPILGNQGFPKPGTQVRVDGTLSRYRDRLQFKVSKPEQLRIAGYVSNAQTAPAARLEDLNKYYTINEYASLLKLEGNLISVRGTVGDYRPSWMETAPNIITITDGTNNLEVVFWDRGEQDVENFSQVGTLVFATGELQNYRGRYQVKIDDLDNLSTKELPRERLAGNLTIRPIAKKVKNPEDQKARILWTPYNPLEVQTQIEKTGVAVIYIRSEKVELSQRVERSYLLHPALVDVVGARTISFFDVSDPGHKVHAKELGISRVPSILVLTKEDRLGKQLAFTSTTTSQEVFEFMKSIPAERKQNQ